MDRRLRQVTAVTANIIRDGLADGIEVADGASPFIAGNDIRGSACQALFVDPDAAPDMGSNTIAP